MKNRRGLSIQWSVIMLMMLLNLLIFGYSLISDWRMRSMEAFELIARLLGYGLNLLVLAFSASKTVHAFKGVDTTKDAKVVLYGSLSAVVLLCVHDALLYGEYGNLLEGTFTMAAFFALDGCLLALYIGVAVCSIKKPRQEIPRALSVGILLLWLIYMVGDMSGYPKASISDWDEPVMKLGFAVPFVVRLLASVSPTGRSDRSSRSL